LLPNSLSSTVNTDNFSLTLFSISLSFKPLILTLPFVKFISIGLINGKSYLVIFTIGGKITND